MNITGSMALGFVCAFAPPLASQVTVEWLHPTRGVSIAVDEANNVFTLDYEQALGAEMVVTKRDVNGHLLWQSSFDQTDPTKWERAAWITTDSHGHAIACGTLMSGYSNPVVAASLVMKLSPTGAVLWRHVYESGFDGSSTVRCLVDADDNVYVLGLGVGPAGLVTKVKKFAPDGTALWSWFDVDGIGAPVRFKLTPDAHLVIAARGIFGSINGYAKITLEGQKVWALAGVQSLTVGDVAGDAAGNAYLVHGQFVSNGGTQVKKLDPGGALLWDETFPLSGFRVEVGADQCAVVAGFPSPSSAGAAFVKVDGDGDPVWSNLDADGPLSLLLHAQLVLDESGDAYLAAGTLFDMAVCKVGADGSSRWTKTVAGSYANALALGRHDDSIFVVGGRTTRWSDPEEGPWHDLGLALDGVAGQPLLIGEGPLVGATPMSLVLQSAAPGAATVLVVGLSALGAPFKGGVMVPQPDLLLAGLATDGAGALQLGATWPTGLVAGTQLWLQAWVADPAGAFGFSSSNGLRATTP